jgi:nucleotide-binding universal stress UspA family protein
MKLLIPIDGSVPSYLALEHALSLGRAGLQAELVLVNVQEPATFYELVTLHDAEALARLTEAAGQDTLAPAVEAAEAAAAPCRAVVVSGDTVPMLLQVLQDEGCDMVVMGAHGKDLVQRSMLGSVSQALLARSPVPVLLVQPVEPADPPEDEASNDD